MPIEGSAGTLDIENATLRSNAIAVLANLVTGNDRVREGGAPALEVYGDPSNGGNEARLELVSNTAAVSSSAFTRLTSNAGVFSIKTGTNASDNGTITFGGFANERLRITSDGKVGIGKTDPGASLDVMGDVELNDIFTIKSTQGNIVKKSFTAYSANGTTRYWKVASGNYDGIPRNQIKMTVNIHRVDTLNSTRRLVMEADGDSLTFRPCIDEHDTQSPSYPRDLRVYKNTSDSTFDIYIQASSYTYVDVEMTYSGNGITVYDTPTWESSEPTTSATYILEFTNGNLNAMKINNSGNVGIGTASPGAKFTLYGDDTQDEGGLLMKVVDRVALPGGFTGIGLGGYATTSAPIIQVAKSAIIHERTGFNGTGNLMFCNDDTTDNNDVSNTHARMTITGAGNVGIGKTDPGERLFVNGNIALNWSDDRRIIMNFDDDYRQGIEFDASTRGMTLFSTTNDAGGTIIFKTRGGSGSSDTDYGTERMRIRSDGNVGIGTTDPKAPLHVNQNKAIINGQMSLQTLNVYKNAGGNSGSQTRRYYRVYVPNSYANFQIILQGFGRNYTGGGDVQDWRRQYTVQRNYGGGVGISHDSGEDINASGFTFATSQTGGVTDVIEVHFDVTLPPKPEGATYISFTAQVMGDTGYFAENTSV